MAHTISIAIPEPQVEYVDQRIARGDYGNRSEYFRELVRRDQQDQARDRLRGLIEDGIASGEPAPWTEQDSAALRSLARGEEG